MRYTIGFFCLVFTIIFLPLCNVATDQARSEESLKESSQLLLNQTQVLAESFQEQNELLLKKLITNAPSSNDSLFLAGFGSQSRACLISLARVQNELVEFHGGVYEDGSLVNAMQTDRTHHFFLGPMNKGKDIKLLLNDFTQLVRESGLPNNPDLALNGKSDPMFKHNKEKAMASFSQLYFSETNLLEALTMLTLFQLRVLHLERKVLEQYL